MGYMTMRQIWSSSALLFVIGCTGPVGPSPGTQPDASTKPDASTGFVEAMPPAMPQLVNLGGTTLATPKVQPIFWAGDTAAQKQIEDFEKQLAMSSYWTTTTSEYGVGPLTIKPTLMAPGTPPTTDTAMLAMLKSQLDGTHAGWVYDPNTIYSMFLPAGVVMTGALGTSCTDYGAYHDEVAGAQNQAIVYALMPRCQGASPAVTLDYLTVSTSHEWIEAVTDPHVNTAPAFGNADNDNAVWEYTPGAETGDYCEYVSTAEQRLVGTFDVQRTWSNAAAKAGHDPCVPAMDAAYVAAAPIFDGTVPIAAYSGTVTTRATQVPLNMSKTIEVQLYSDQPTADFTVGAIDATAFLGGTAELSFQWDKQTGHNGDKLHLIITRKVAGQATMGGSEFVITATSGTTPTALYWGFAAN